jgi:predicted heme/steroid binding protein
MKKLLLVLSLLVGLNSVALNATGTKHVSHGDVNTEFTLEQLAKYDGKNGNKAYVAVDGVVYDVTNAEYWKNGTHVPTEGKLQAGIDATEVIKKSPHGKKVLAELPVVGKLKK